MGRLQKTGFVTGNDGYAYYYDDCVMALGFTKVGENYYFFNAGSGKMYKDTNLWVGKQQLRRRVRYALLPVRRQDVCS